MAAWLYVGFVLLVIFFLWVDLAVLNRKAHVVSIREALRWTVMWIVLALLFSVFLYYCYEHHWFGMGLDARHTVGGREAVGEYLLGYVVEKSLSLDNIFVIALIFGYFAVPREEEHRVLFWGVLGAVVMRGAMIALGATLVHRFEWMIQVFGVILLVTAIRMLTSSHEPTDPQDNPLVKLARRVYPVTEQYEGDRFFTRLPDGRRAMTPLFVVLLVIESTDLLFAVDSIPAIFGITTDPFIVFTSNVFAILGLRALFFVVQGMLVKFRYMKASLFIVLGYIAVKMLLANQIHISTGVSLAVIFGVLGIGLAASLLLPAPAEPDHEGGNTQPLPAADESSDAGTPTP